MRRNRQIFADIMLALLIFSTPVMLGVDAFTYSNPVVKSGNMYYKNKDYKKSLKQYLGAENELKDKKKIYSNIAGAYYKMNDFDNALKHYELALDGDDSEFNAKIIFNMGNCYFKAGDLQKAYDRYKASLRLNSADMDTKYNLEFVLSMMDKNKKNVPKRKGANDKVSRKNNGNMNNDNRKNPPNDGKKSNEIGSDDFNKNNDFGDFTLRDDLEEVTKNDALRILSTLTEQVIVRTPMRKESLTKRGEENEKDW